MEIPVKAPDKPSLEDVERVSGPFSFAEYQWFFDAKKGYLSLFNPNGVVRYGLIEETWEVSQTDIEDKEEFAREIGDIFFYLNASADLSDSNLESVMAPFGYSSLADIQAGRRDRMLDIYDLSGDRIDTELEIDDLVTVDLLRVVDMLNPKTVELWNNFDRMPDCQTILAQAIFSLAAFADTYDIRLNEAAKLTFQRIYSRERKPHVIEDDDGKLRRSHRERVKMHPMVTGMRQTNFDNNLDDICKVYDQKPPGWIIDTIPDRS